MVSKSYAGTYSTSVHSSHAGPGSYSGGFASVSSSSSSFGSLDNRGNFGDYDDAVGLANAAAQAAGLPGAPPFIPNRGGNGGNYHAHSGGRPGGVVYTTDLGGQGHGVGHEYHNVGPDGETHSSSFSGVVGPGIANTPSKTTVYKVSPDGQVHKQTYST